MVKAMPVSSPHPFSQFAYYLRVASSLGQGNKDKLSIFWKQTKNLRVRLGLGRHKPDEIYGLNTRFGRMYFRDNFGDITNLGNIFYREAYPIHKLVTDGVILDVGANIGLAAAWFIYHNPDREIYCFEPLKGNTELILKNCPQAHLANVAVGANPDQVEMMVDSNSVMASTVPRAILTAVQTFNVNTIDFYIREYSITKIALMKIDVEGMELDVLKGGMETIGRTDMIVLETHGHDRHTACRYVLENAGFKIKQDDYDKNTGLILGKSRNP